MVFKITVARQPFAVEFETGSVSEAIGVLEAEGTEFAKLFDINFGHAEAAPAAAGEVAGTAEGGGKPPRKPRTPRNDPAVAVAPPPLAVPGAPPSPPTPPAPVDMTPGPNGIPAGLARDPATNTAPAFAAPPPLMPAAPPIAPAPPVSGPVGQRVIAELDRRAVSPDAKTQLSDWLAASGLTIKGATYDEAIACLRMIGDDKFAAVAGVLFPA